MVRVRERRREREKDKGDAKAGENGAKWREALAGAVSGAVTRTVIAPLDVLKIRFQVQREAVSSSSKIAVGKYRGVLQAVSCVVKEEGIVGLWRGTVPGLLLTVPYTAVQFFTIESFKSATAKHRGKRQQGQRELLDTERLLSFAGGACAGVAATAASYPFDLLRTTMAAQGVPRQYPTMLHAAKGIISQRGFFGGMYAGLGVTIVEIIPYAALQFGLYDIFTTLYDRAVTKTAGSTPVGIGVDRTSRSRTVLSRKERTERQKGSGDLRTCDAEYNDHDHDHDHDHDSKKQKGKVVQWNYLLSKSFVCGLASGFIAKFATHPLDVVKKRYQVAGLKRAETYGKGFAVKEVAVLGIFQLLARTMKEEGIHGIYKGVTPSLLKSAPSAAITFAVYSLALEYINKTTT